jgi:WD40 repeat protein
MNVAIDPSNRYLAAAIGAPERVPLATSVFRLFDLSTGQELLSLDRETKDIDEIFGTGVAFSQDGEFVYLSTSDGLVHQWHIATGVQEIIGDGATRGIRILVYTSDNKVAYFTEDGFRTTTGEAVQQNFLASPQLTEKPWWLMATITAHPSEPLVAIGYIVPSEGNTTPDARDSIVQVWDIQAGELRFETLFSEPWPHSLVDLSFNPDGTLLASVSSDGTVRLWGVPASGA